MSGQHKHMQKIGYKRLNARQKETYNFQKVSAVLADYGFATIKLNDDWQGADFIAQHIDGKVFLKVQLKGRLTFDKKYIGKNIYICFPYTQKDKTEWYLYKHDKLLKVFLKKYKNKMAKSSSWIKEGLYSWNNLSKEIIALLLREYKL